MKVIAFGLGCAFCLLLRSTHMVRAADVLRSDLWKDSCSVPAIDREWLVRFPEHTDLLQPRNRDILNEMLQEWRQLGGAYIGIKSFASETEQSASQSDLAERRGQAVKNFLVAGGIAPDRIWLDTSSDRSTSEAAKIAVPPVFILNPYGLGFVRLLRQRRDCLTWILKYCGNQSEKENDDLCLKAEDFVAPVK